MQAKSINPYGELEQKITEALDFIITNLPLNPTFAQLNEVLLTALYGGPGGPMDDDVLPVFLNAVLPLTYNGYVNGGLTDGGWQLTANTENHALLRTANRELRTLLLNGLHGLPFERIGDFLSSMDDAIAGSGLPYQEQMPLFFAVQSAKAQHAYWTAQMATPGGWALYMNADPAINYMRAGSWVAASIEGALLSYGLIKPQQAQFPDMFSGIIGAIGLPAGKVVFGWVSMQSPAFKAAPVARERMAEVV